MKVLLRRDVLSGALRQAIFRIGERNVRSNYGDQVVQMCLRALGAHAETISEIMRLERPDVRSLGPRIVQIIE